MKGLAIAAVMAATAGIAACGGSGGASHHAMVTVRGSFGGIGGAQCVSAGDQVAIKSASGKLLATPLLGAQKMVTMKVGGISVPLLEYPYSARVPAQARYSLSVGGKAPYYVSLSQFKHGVDLSC